MKREREVVILMSGPFSGMSGGDVHALRLCDALAHDGSGRVTLIAPASFAELPRSVRPVLLPVSTPLDGHVSSMPAYLVTVTLCALRAVWLAPAAKVAIASSHFFFDVVPAVVMRRRHGTRVAAYVYHLIGESDRGGGLRNRLSTALESFSLFAATRRRCDLR